MITDADIKKMKKVFTTKDDLKAFATKGDLMAMEKRQDQKFATKGDLKQSLKPINKKLDTIIQHFDRDISWHNRRLKNIEKIMNIETPEFISLNPMKY